MKPFIGLTSNWTSPRYYAPGISIPSLYIKGVMRAGGIPIILSAIMKDNGFDDVFERLNGVLIIGGPDMDSNIWGKPLHPMSQPMKPEPQEFNNLVIRKAYEQRMPILAICLGCQEVNAALGGTLCQDVPSAFPDSRIPHRKKVGCSFTYHTVSVEPGSLLSKVAGSEEINVNSSHHQAVDEAAAGLRIVARAPDGVVEAIESDNHKPVLAVQWHPEHLADKQEEHFNLFKWLVNEAGKAL